MQNSFMMVVVIDVCIGRPMANRTGKSIRLPIKQKLISIDSTTQIWLVDL